MAINYILHNIKFPRFELNGTSSTVTSLWFPFFTFILTRYLNTISFHSFQLMNPLKITSQRKPSKVTINTMPASMAYKMLRKV